MHLTQKLVLLSIALTVSACATPPPPVSLGLGPIICPRSVTEELKGLEEISSEFVSKLSEADQEYILSRETEWEAVVGLGNDSLADAMDACSDYNSRLRELGSPE